MVEDIVGAVTVVVVFRKRNVVDGKADAVLFRGIHVQAAIVLGSRKFSWVDGVVIRDIGHGAQRAASGSAASAGATAAGVLGANPSKILTTQACRQRRTDIEARLRLPRSLQRGFER